LGIVDAQSADKVVVEYTGDGVSGETLIKKAKESFRNLYRTGGSPGASISGTINGTIATKYDPYVKSGNTHQWFTVSTDSGKYDYLMRADVLDDEAVLRLQKVPEHQTISFEADTNNVVRQVL
jgi:hypothetical protein